MTQKLQLKHPIVLVHGMGAKSKYGPVDYFYGLPKLLRDAGNSVFVADLTAYHSLETRSKELEDQLIHAFPEGRVNLIGHSMGGLDARMVAGRLGSNHVASVTTIGTPNRGSALLDVMLGLVPGRTFAAADRYFASQGWSVEGIRQITRRAYDETLSKTITNADDVAYFSAMSVIKAPLFRSALPVFWGPNKILEKLEGENDGFVSLESSKWGDHICTYYGDHYAQIGQLLGRTRGLNYQKFLNEIVSRLKREGF